MHPALIISLSIILGLVLLYLLISLFVYIVIFYSPNKQQKKGGDYPDDPLYSGTYDAVRGLIDTLKKEPCEEVFIKSFDKKILRGRYYHHKDNAPIALCFHGYRGTPIRDFCGGYQIMKSMGINVLLVDERAHLKSQGHTITFGVKESKDALSWINYVNNRFIDAKIILVGISMGGYIVGNVIMNNDDLKNVKGAIMDCPFYSPKEILKTSCVRDVHIPWWIGFPLLATASNIYGHFSFTKKKDNLRGKKSFVKFMVIHGDKDSIVPVEFSEYLMEKNPEMKRYLFEGADHGLSYLIDPNKYQEYCVNFVNECLND